MKKILNERLIKYICLKNEICMAHLAGDAASGEIPMQKEEMGASWSPNNPYKRIAGILSKMEDSEDGQSSDALPDMNKKNKEGRQKLDDMGLKNVKFAEAFYKSDFSEIESEKLPKKKSITKALNTFKIAFRGEKQKTMDRIDQMCKVELMSEPLGNNLVRLVSLLPFLGMYDPWLEYFNVVKEKLEENNK